MRIQPRYKPRAQFTGSLVWLCPFCAFVNRSRVDRTGWRLRCGEKDCRRSFTYGLNLYTLSNLQGCGTKVLPPSDVTFPTVPFDSWESGAPVHRLITTEEESKHDAD